jgi:hypothetical protein
MKQKKVSLYPLKFEEVSSDVLRIKPEPKPPKKQTAKRRNR